MGFAIVTGFCVGCNNIIQFNPNYVPSIRIDNVKQPICRSCIERINPKRVANGLEPVTIHPQAYEPCDESELKSELNNE